MYYNTNCHFEFTLNNDASSCRDLITDITNLMDYIFTGGNTIISGNEIYNKACKVSRVCSCVSDAALVKFIVKTVGCMEGSEHIKSFDVCVNDCFLTVRLNKFGTIDTFCVDHGDTTIKYIIGKLPCIKVVSNNISECRYEVVIDAEKRRDDIALVAPYGYEEYEELNDIVSILSNCKIVEPSDKLFDNTNIYEDYKYNIEDYVNPYDDILKGVKKTNLFPHYKQH